MKHFFNDTLTTVQSTLAAFVKLFKFYFVPNNDVMSDEAKKIFSNYEDRKKYIEAVEYLKKNPTETKEIELSTKEKLTLMSSIGTSVYN